MTKNRIEILSPAGSFDSVKAAVNRGADAVYVGMKRFSARAHAQNFDEAGLKEATAFCHRRGVKVYVALNTLLFDDEIEDALKTAKAAARADADALILQDLGLFSLIKEAIPDMRLHASTQLSVHTPRGAKALFELGFKRVVLSRELTLEEIEEIHRFCPEIELEVFVHGALCVCLSGQCLFSSMLGGRSANRGMCAQPCRLPFFSGDNEHALSLKDNGGLKWLKRLEELGVTSAKIEGRMKRPEYVAAATAAAKETRDGTLDQAQIDRLKAVFSRSGFTDGFLTGERGEEMFGFRRKDDVLASDERLLKEIRNETKKETPKTAVDFSLLGRIGQPLTLKASDGTHTAQATSSTVLEKAKQNPTSADRLKAALQKTGGTHFFAQSVHIEVEEGAFIASATINALRRDVLEQLDQQREINHHYHINDHFPKIGEEEIMQEGAPDRVCLKELWSSPMFKDKLLCIDLLAMTDETRIREMIEQGYHLAAEIPRALFGTEEKTKEKLKQLKEIGVKDAIAHNIGAAHLAKELGISVGGGFSLNITNSFSLRFWRDFGLKTAELSPEIDQKRILKLRQTLPIGCVCYGHLPLMITRAEVIHGVSEEERQQREDCKIIGFLQDRKGERFPVMHQGSAKEVLNIVPLIFDETHDFRQKPVFHVFRFSVENSVEKVEKILRNHAQNQKPERFTHGLYLKGVKKFTIV